MKTITQRIYRSDLDTIKRWMYVLEIKSFAELVHNWVVAVDLHKKNEFYSKLTPIIKQQPKVLSGCKINKKKKCIQDKCTTYV